MVICSARFSQLGMQCPKPAHLNKLHQWMTPVAQIELSPGIRVDHSTSDFRSTRYLIFKLSLGGQSRQICYHMAICWFANVLELLAYVTTAQTRPSDSGSHGLGSLCFPIRVCHYQVMDRRGL